MASEKQVLDALSTIIDPDFNRDIVSLGFIKELSIESGKVRFAVELTTPACPLADQFEQDARRVVAALPDVTEVSVRMTARPRKARELVDGSGLSETASIIAVSSCKGGVGKSTVAAMLACQLSARGHAVGLLDADIFGPSLPTLFNEHTGGVTANENGYIIPRQQEGLKLMSFGFIGGSGPAVMRGPMVANFIQQMLHHVAWGPLDYLVIDMPPGTGDTQLTISQTAQIDAAVIVTTPHQLSITDVRKGIQMFDKVDVPVIGVIENMAYFKCSSCDQRHEIFGPPASHQLEEKFGIPTLAELPIDQAMSASLAAITAAPAAVSTTDAVIRALGKQALKKQPRPELAWDADRITLTWPDNDVIHVDNRALRLACKCALCIDEMSNTPILDPASIPADIHAEEIVPIGNYAIMVTWSDGHNTGFYPYRQLRELAEQTTVQ
jgi:ATP-binding protein involved in chromosome partitioning